MIRRSLYARHLEVFVPRPTSYASERALQTVLDKVLQEPTIPRTPLHMSRLGACSKKLRHRLEVGGHWENILFGYSKYIVEGMFLSTHSGIRNLSTSMSEITLVLKCIITNYETTIDRENLSLLNGIGTALLENDERRPELVITRHHYRDTCEFIVNLVEKYVLSGEIEVWSQEWETLLDRRASGAAKAPISRRQRVSSVETHQRSGLICVCDYVSSSVNGTKLLPKKKATS